MPTVVLQVGQCGNQLGAALWTQMLYQQQQQQLPKSSKDGSLSLAREFFSAGSSNAEDLLVPRVICIDSEPKVVGGQLNGCSGHRLHILGHAGCGNNWACGYSFGASGSSRSASCSWSGGEDAATNIDRVLQGIRKECELATGVPDFLMMASLAGGTGSGTGSALLEAIADEFPASTVAAVAVAPGQSGDTSIQSINSCLAMQHLQMYAHAVLLLDNQAILDQLNRSCSTSTTSFGWSPHKQPFAGQQKFSASSALHECAAPGTAKGVSPGVVRLPKSRSAPASCGSGRACLAQVNQVAAEALVGLLWPLGESDLLAGRSNIRQLAATICADPRTKFVEICHMSQPEQSWLTSCSPWPARIKLLSSQLTRFERCTNDKQDSPVTTSAALLIARAMPGTATHTHVQQAARTAAAMKHTPVSAAASSASASCWYSPDCLGALPIPGDIGAPSLQGCWQHDAFDAVCSSWPYFVGNQIDVHLGQSPMPIWSSMHGHLQPCITAAARRSSIGGAMHAAAARCLQMCDAGAYMHWYERYGCSKDDICAAAATVAEIGEAYWYP